MKRIKVIIKRPDERYGHVTNISSTLKNLQGIVHGYIQTVYLGNRLVMICNEDGKNLGLPKNFIIGTPPFIDVVVGPVILCGIDEDEFTDVPISFDFWKMMLDRWKG